MLTCLYYKKVVFEVLEMFEAVILNLMMIQWPAGDLTSQMSLISSSYIIYSYLL